MKVYDYELNERPHLMVKPNWEFAVERMLKQYYRNVKKDRWMWNSV